MSSGIMEISGLTRSSMRSWRNSRDSPSAFRTVTVSVLSSNTYDVILQTPDASVETIFPAFTTEIVFAFRSKHPKLCTVLSKCRSGERLCLS